MQAQSGFFDDHINLLSIIACFLCSQKLCYSWHFIMFYSILNINDHEHSRVCKMATWSQEVKYNLLNHLYDRFSKLPKKKNITLFDVYMTYLYTFPNLMPKESTYNRWTFRLIFNLWPWPKFVLNINLY